MKTIRFALPVVFLFLVFSCQQPTNSTQTNNQVQNEQAGTRENVFLYIGTLPCADCQGIRTEVMLQYNDMTFKLSERYLEKDDALPYLYEGVFSEINQNEKLIIKLEMPENAGFRYYQKTDNRQLIMLDQQGETIESTLDYSLNQEYPE
ncbi:MAG: copper resistance protein NlpE [Bacteroidales bacterium]|nr:copper resistance protein NlpE [Bacteroidales bacterium]